MMKSTRMYPKVSECIVAQSIYHGRMLLENECCKCLFKDFTSKMCRWTPVFCLSQYCNLLSVDVELLCDTNTYHEQCQLIKELISIHLNAGKLQW